MTTKRGCNVIVLVYRHLAKKCSCSWKWSVIV